MKKFPIEIARNVTDVAGLKQAAGHPYTMGDRSYAVKIGFLLGAAEQGVSPEQAEAALSKCAEQKQAIGGGIGNLFSAGVKGTVVMGLLGALAGSATGKAHYNMERRLDKREDPENNRERAKLDALGRMKLELESDLASRGVEP